ncbi:MAG TPA: carboxypeptidase regulatory-like domain-containing protein [Pyrinomonadaceae bacterium]|nr:carboxypeptidase regulatory-like domain-containing protein [Pyrinomonadaceae bacterium]
MRTAKFILALCVMLWGAALSVAAQTTGSISGQIQDEKGAAIPNAAVTVRNVQTNESRVTQTDEEGRYRVVNLPVGDYEVTVEAPGFARYVQSGITLLLNQPAVVDASMKAGGVAEVVNVTENAALLNTTTAEVSTRFDSRRLSELPLTTTRNVYNIALSAPGVSQLQSNQAGFTNGINYSANGGRLRSNNFLIDGQDNNDFGVGGGAVQLNNPDLIQEVRLVTNQFTAEYGRNSSSVFNAITKSGTNEYHGSGFWFHNDNALNACDNLSKRNGFCNPNAADPSRRHAPFRVENQTGMTVGGPLHLPRFGQGGRSYISGRDRTFFFFSLQRWWDRQLGSGIEVRTIPTAEGRATLQNLVGNRPQVRALLDFLPPAQTPIPGAFVNFTLNGVTVPVAVGSLSGTSATKLDDWQSSFRVDHRFTDNHILNARYIYQDQNISGAGQSTPPGYESANVSRNQGVNLALNSVLSPRVVNELRGAFLRSGSATVAADLRAEAIPSIQINDLGLQGLNAGATRTAIGLAANLPQNSIRNTYQLQDNLSYAMGDHALKFGGDIRRNQLHQLFKPTTRGHLVYETLTAFVNDVAATAQVNRDLAGTARVLHLDWHDFFFYAQDEWRIRPNFTLTYGLRYENPGQPIADLVDFNAPVLAAAGGDERFRVGPIPPRDKNNFQPRIGFNWNPRTRSTGLLGLITGGDRLVLRGGYSRTNDYAFTNIALNIWSSFPFVQAVNVSNLANAFTTFRNQPLNPAAVTRTTVTPDFHSPDYDSYSLEIQRELTRDVVLRVGYVGTKGTGLFESIDANPVLFRTRRAGETPIVRQDPTRATVRLRANSGSSIYHSMQTSLEKRLSQGFSAGAHFTWSSFIDTSSEIFNNSAAEIAVAQDPYDRRSERGRSSYDRPLRLAVNGVYELPFFREQNGVVGHLLGGWQVNASLALQSGAPFSVLNGSDPTGTLSGISGAIGIATRANVVTTADVSRMSVEELVRLRAAGDPLFAPLTCVNTGTTANPITNCQRVGNSGRNILRADGINNLDFGLLKNVRISETHKLQLRADFFNATNTRDFGTPNSTVTAGTNFLNQWGTNGGNRRIVVGARYVF